MTKPKNPEMGLQSGEWASMTPQEQINYQRICGQAGAFKRNALAKSQSYQELRQLRLDMRNIFNGK